MTQQEGFTIKDMTKGDLNKVLVGFFGGIKSKGWLGLGYFDDKNAFHRYEEDSQRKIKAATVHLLNTKLWQPAVSGIDSIDFNDIEFNGIVSCVSTLNANIVEALAGATEYADTPTCSDEAIQLRSG